MDAAGVSGALAYRQDFESLDRVELAAEGFVDPGMSPSPTATT